MHQCFKELALKRRNRLRLHRVQTHSDRSGRKAGGLTPDPLQTVGVSEAE